MSLSVEEMQQALKSICEKSVEASRALAVMNPEDKVICLNNMAKAIEDAREDIKKANNLDIEQAKKNGMNSAMLDRLTLNDARIDDMANGIRIVAAQKDPVGKVLDSKTRPNGLKIDKVSVPLGVIAIIYESRPNVTADAAGICIKAGNAVILRGGSEAFHSNSKIAEILNNAGIKSGLPYGAVQLIPWTDRQAVGLMLRMNDYIDLVIPRGGEGLIRTVVEQSLIPVIKHYKGICHTYIDSDCDIEMALEISKNAKCQRPSACNALETILINEKIADKFIPRFMAMMKENKVKVRAEADFCKKYTDAEEMDADGFYEEYLDFILSAKIVSNVKEAVSHINKYGSKHSDSIISNIENNVKYFIANVDSATVYHNASTRFTDGGEFGMGAEIGISTDKLHARGPMGADELTSTKFIIHGKGQIRQ